MYTAVKRMLPVWFKHGVKMGLWWSYLFTKQVVLFPLKLFLDTLLRFSSIRRYLVKKLSTGPNAAMGDIQIALYWEKKKLWLHCLEQKRVELFGLESLKNAEIARLEDELSRCRNGDEARDD